MRVVHRTAAGDRIVELEITDPSATIADLTAALSGRSSNRVDPTTAGDGMVVDEIWRAADSPLSAAAIFEGSVLSSEPIPTEPTPTARALSIIGGVRAGVAHPIATGGRVSVGRAGGNDLVVADPAMAERHFVIHGESVAPLDASARVVVDGFAIADRAPARLALDAVVAAGATRLSVRACVDDRPVAVVDRFGAAGGVVPFNRPPRVAPSMDPAPLDVPAEPPVPTEAEPLSWAGIVLPVAMGVVVALVLSPLFALFAALGPVLTIGTWWERRRRRRREQRAVQEALASALGALASELPLRRDEEIRRRRRLHPDPAEVVRRACGPSVRCWERRESDPDFLHVGIGAGDEPLDLPVVARGEEPAGAVADMVAGLAPMVEIPLAVDLAPGRVVGIVGPAAAGAALGRGLLVQVATHHGPADAAIALAADRPDQWEWAGWLPHTTDPATGRRAATVLSTGDRQGADAAVALAGERALVALIAGDDPLQGRTTAGRRLLESARAAAVVIVPDAHRLPAGCTTLVRIDDDGRVEVIDPRQAGPGRTGLAWGLPAEVATDAARRLARLDDPELALRAAGVPAAVSLFELLGPGEMGPELIERRWARTRGTADLVTPVGTGPDGPLLLDLVADGPHVLLGGTTGSGKSELLRALVAGLAASADPDHVAFVLVDYKGGAAFDCCADLPHVAGLVTDLDADLAARALRCLEAELRHREQCFRAVGADDLAAFRAHPAARDAEPLPRLVVVVDEFASLAAELPDFLDALVGIAQRGRSLGVHLVLATQRPAGVVTDDIRANAGCRIALRVTDAHDSADVVGSPDAAQIPRSRPGRAIARFGPGELVAFQAPQVTGHTARRRAVRIAEPDEMPPVPQGPSDLSRLVDAVRVANRRRGGGIPRSPWPPPLPEAISRDELADPVGWLLVDEPDRQRRTLAGWSPGDGHLVVVGGPRSGTTTTLATAALAAIRDAAPGDIHVHALDLDAGGLAPLDGLDSVGTVVVPTDRERRVRLLRWLDEEVVRRRTDGADSPAIVLLVDDLAGLARSHDPVREPEIHERLDRIWAEGPSVGLTLAVSVRRSADLPPAFAATAGLMLLHRSTDPADGLRFGAPAPGPRAPAGRVVRVDDGATAQVIRDHHDLASAVAALAASAPPPRLPPHRVPTLAPVIPAATVAAGVAMGPDRVDLAVAVRDHDVAIATMTLCRGDHALVLGPARSGRTNALEVIGGAFPSGSLVVGEGDLAARLGVEPIAPAAVRAHVTGAAPALVLVDDCTEVEDPTGELDRLVRSPPPGVHVIAAARPDRLRNAYGHWSAGIGGSRTGLLLRPDPLDGDLLGASLPARLELAPIPGRGVQVVDGRSEIVQVVAAPAGAQSTS